MPVGPIRGRGEADPQETGGEDREDGEGNDRRGDVEPRDRTAPPQLPDQIAGDGDGGDGGYDGGKFVALPDGKPEGIGAHEEGQGQEHG